jgi:hypothetical protein
MRCDVVVAMMLCMLLLLQKFSAVFSQKKNLIQQDIPTLREVQYIDYTTTSSSLSDEADYHHG